MNTTEGKSKFITTKDANPFPGLRPFQADEAHLFFGRERYIDTVIEKLTKHHFVSIVGNSGSGKSSLLRAGVIPKLIAQKDWILITMRPGKSPVEELVQTLLTVTDLTFSLDEADSLKILQQNELGLVQLLRNAIPNQQKVVLVVDQFEELFRFNKEHEEIAVQFVNLLLKAIEQNDIPIYVIITLRSDFIGDCEQFIGLPEAINNGQFLIPRMKREELQLSIVGPIEFVGQRISPRLVQLLIKDVGSNPDQLPILQHVLMRTWDVWMDMHEENTPIDLQHYEKTGKMDKALSNHAEEAMLELKTAEQQKIASILFKTLTIKESDNRGVRRPTSLKKISEIANTDIETLISIINVFRDVERGFLMPPSNVAIHEKSMIDISHESLMRVWERLAVWVNEEYESAQIYQRLSASALLYEKGLSGLWRDPDLQIALDWDAKNNVTQQWAEQYNQHFQLSKRFLAASLDQKQFLIAEKRRNKKLTQMLVLSALVILSGLSIWAFFERNKSEVSEQLALTEKQNAQAQETIAKQQKLQAEENAIQAEREKQNAERQQQIAMQKEEEATKQKQIAVNASRFAESEKKRAEFEKILAIQQRAAADSLRKVATISERNAYRLRILSVSQSMAIKSAAILKGTYDEDLKLLLALQAYRFNKEYKGKSFDVDIYKALYEANKWSNHSAYFKNSSHTDMVRSVAFSPDGKELASTGSDGTLIISNSTNIEQNTKIFSKVNAILDNLCFSDDGNKIACLADKNTVLIFDKNKSSIPSKELKGIHSDIITGMCWNKNELITIGNDRTLKITDDVSQKTLASIQLPARPICLTLYSEKQKVFIGLEDGTILQVSLHDQVIGTVHKLEVKPSSITVSANASLLAIGSVDGSIHVIPISGSSHHMFTLNQHISTVTSLCFDNNGKKLVSASLDGLIYLWDINHPDNKPMTFKEHESWVWSVSFNPTENLFCSGGKDKHVYAYVATEDELVKKIEPNVKRNLTLAEWKQFVGSDITYEKTVNNIK